MHRHCGTNNRAPRWTFTGPCKPEMSTSVQFYIITSFIIMHYHLFRSLKNNSQWICVHVSKCNLNVILKMPKLVVMIFMENNYI